VLYFIMVGCPINDHAIKYYKRIAEAVPQFAFWLVWDGKDVVGSSRLRPQLAPDMAGGHIDYGIRASERRKGYGTCQLALLKEEARLHGMPPGSW
jgi:predicted acetyltransferase